VPVSGSVKLAWLFDLMVRTAAPEGANNVSSALLELPGLVENPPVLDSASEMLPPAGLWNV
jgi:hypothetical protein